MNQKSYFILALILALFAAGAVFLYLDKLEKSVKDDKNYATVLVVKDYIPARTLVTANMVDSRKIVRSAVQESAILDRNKVIGMVTKVPLYAGEQFLPQKLAGSGTELKEGLAFSIGEGKRAVAVQVNEVIAVGNMVLPGDKVDVVVVVEKDNTGYAALLVQNIRVLAVGQTLATGATSLQASTVTLEVTPREAQEIVLATERGRIRLLLRRATGEDTVNIPPYKLEDLF